ncbi:unnamed protein product [Caenorhabditis nigoni]
MDQEVGQQTNLHDGPINRHSPNHRGQSELDMQMKSPNEFTGSFSQEETERDKKTLEFFEEIIEKRDNGCYKGI